MKEARSGTNIKENTHKTVNDAVEGHTSSLGSKDGSSDGSRDGCQ